MKPRTNWARWCLYAAAGLAVIQILALGTVPEVQAAEGGAGWRPTYDLIMRWVNFIILAVLLVKLVRVPLKNFIQGRQQEIKQEMEDLDQQRQAAETAIAEAEAKLADSSSRLATIKARIVDQGKARKAEIIANAQKEGEMMIAAARLKVDSQLQSATDQLRADLVDLAVEQALKRLPDMITEEDNQRIVAEYMAAAKS